MPNWPLSRTIRDHLKGRAKSVAVKAVNLARAEFPLTVAQIQYGGVGLTDEQIATLRRLTGEGVKTISQHNFIRLAFLTEVFPELRRGIVLRLQLPEPIYVSRGTHYGMTSPSFDVNDDAYLVPKSLNLTPDERKVLIDWLESLLRQQRIYELVTHCVDDILSESAGITPTVAHLQAVWPMLATLVKPKDAGYKSERKRLQQWAERFRNPPSRNLRIYRPSERVERKYASLIKVCDTQIAAGVMLPEIDPDSVHNYDGRIVPVLEHWEHLRGDITFPLPEPV